MSHYFQSPTARSTPSPPTTTAPNSSQVLFWAKNSRTFQRHILHFIFQGPHLVQKKPWNYVFFRVFLILSQHEQFYPGGLSVFVPFKDVRIWVGKLLSKLKGLSSTNCNFQALSRSSLDFSLKIQGHSRTFKVHAFAYQATSLTKFGFREIPAAASKTEE